MTLPVSIADIEAAAARLDGVVHRTPVMASSAIDAIAGASLHFKCENLQRTGAFKYRGACNAVALLDDDTLRAGVATHSSGNHGAALAAAAAARGAPAVVVMPRNANRVKRAAVRHYGGEVVHCDSNQRAREDALNAVLEERSMHAVPPYDDVRIVAGQGTAALELMQDTPDLDVVMTPVGGGGLLSGTAIAASERAGSKAIIIGAEPAGADDTYQSFKAGKIVPTAAPDTIADGLRATIGEIPFSIITERVERIITVTEEQIVDAMRLMLERLKLVIEPSSAVAMAAVLKEPDRFTGKRVGIVLSGGNIDLDDLPWMKRDD